MHHTANAKRCPEHGVLLITCSSWKHHGYDPTEQDEIIEMFTDLLRLPTQDGGKKRRAKVKVNWKVDPGHLPGLFSHLDEYFHGRLVDKDSKTHPMVHAAWRCLALALQDIHRGEAGWL